MQSTSTSPVCMNVYNCVQEAVNEWGSREIVKRLKADGWFEVAQVGSHKQFKHPEKSGRVTVPWPRKDVPTGTILSIEKQAGIKLR
ncbi:MAG: type II toxin-antitoxin system HicA family toxin [Terracidiphilus sp.]